MSGMRVPAAMLMTSGCARCGASPVHTSRITCGLTANTSVVQSRAIAAPSALQRTPKFVESLARAASLGSATQMLDAAKPCLTMPPIKACAMLPPPIKPI